MFPVQPVYLPHITLVAENSVLLHQSKCHAYVTNSLTDTEVHLP